jgi:hypothetical protein
VLGRARRLPAADNPIDGELVADLENMVERTRLELERLAADAER